MTLFGSALRRGLPYRRRAAVIFSGLMPRLCRLLPAVAAGLIAIPGAQAADTKPAPIAAATKPAEAAPAPPVPIPTPTPPSPNAYDYYVRAIEAVKDVRFDNPDLALSASDKQEIIDKNAEALKLCREAEKYPFQAPPIRTFDIDFGSFSAFRSLGRLLRFRSELQGTQGKWPEAAISALDAVDLGIKMTQNGPLIQTLVGNAVESIGRKPLADAIPHLDAPAAIDLAARLKKIEANRPSYAAVLKEELISSEASALELMADEAQWAGFMQNSAFGGHPPTKKSVLDLYVAYMNKAIESAHKPFVAPTKPPVHDKGLDQMEASGDPTFRVKFDANRADNAIMIVQLGLQAFRKSNGDYPDKISALSPAILPELPADPFAPSTPIRYVKTGSGFILYSVGPDGKDNSGAPIDDSSLNKIDDTGRLRHIVTATSKGDIVAGVNTF